MLPVVSFKTSFIGISVLPNDTLTGNSTSSNRSMVGGMSLRPAGTALLPASEWLACASTLSPPAGCAMRATNLGQPVLPVPHTFIFGAGHISKSLSKVATLAGFASVVIDNRDTFANRERFPEAAEVHAAEYEEVFPKLAINETSYLVIVTRGHRDDMRVLSLAIATPARYIAMIGSKRKVLNVIRELEKQGIARAALERIHAPMGLDIGAISPEEIAISVTAEMIAVRRNARSNWRSLSMSVFAGEGERVVLSQ